MKKKSRRERKVYEEGRAAGYAEGYKNGLYDGNPSVLYICDHKACKKGITYGADACDPCGHTRNIRHAANFEPLNDNDGRVLAYVERAETDEGGGAHD